MERYIIVERYADNGELSHRALVDSTDGRELGTDGGEPEDQSFWRDWAWVPAELNKAQATVEELQRERDEAVHARGVYEKLYGVAGMDRNIALNETKTLQAALDAEREKVKELEATQAEYEKCTDEQIVALSQGCLDYEKELSQLQALVLALPKCEGWVSVIQAATDEWHIYDGIFTTEESAHAYAALLTHRATLGATTPAQTDEQRFIEACCEQPHDG